MWEKKEDGVWVGPGGERREELVLVDSDAEQEEVELEYDELERQEQRTEREAAQQAAGVQRG